MDDIRWKQRLQNYEKSLNRLKQVENAPSDKFSSVEKAGILRIWQITHELAKNTMFDFLKHRGVENFISIRTALPKLADVGISIDENQWLHMEKSRANALNCYKDELLEEEYQLISTRYISCLNDYLTSLRNLLKIEYNIQDNQPTTE